MNIKRGQTSTEYLIILAVVIVIALIVASILGDFPGIGSGTTKNIDNYKLSTGTVGVNDYAGFNDSYIIEVANNHFDTLEIESVTIRLDNGSTITQTVNETLNVGQSTKINFTSFNKTSLTGVPEVNIVWKDVITEATYSTNPGIAGVEDTTGGGSTVPCNNPALLECWSTTQGQRSWASGVEITGINSETNGKENTDALIAIDGPTIFYPAARFCDDLEEGGFDDWYLPAKDQLLAGWTAHGTSIFTSCDYWSSTEALRPEGDPLNDPLNRAWNFYCGFGGMMSDGTKGDSYSVRCLR